MTWTWNVEWFISYENSYVTQVDATTWTANISWTPAYINTENTFTWLNEFQNITRFLWQVSFQYTPLSEDVSSVNADDWNKQSVIWNASNTLNMTNLVNWATLILAIVASTEITLTLWNFAKKDWTWNYNKYSIWWTSYPLTLSTWANMLVFEVFSTWIHITSLWLSAPII
jgi:hypothetical protein